MPSACWKCTIQSGKRKKCPKKNQRNEKDSKMAVDIYTVRPKIVGLLQYSKNKQIKQHSQ